LSGLKLETVGSGCFSGCLVDRARSYPLPPTFLQEAEERILAHTKDSALRSFHIPQPLQITPQWYKLHFQETYRIPLGRCQKLCGSTNFTPGSSMICESVQPPLSPSVMLQSPSKKNHRKAFNESKEEVNPTYYMEYYNDVEKLQCCDPPIIVSDYSSSDYSIDNIRSQAIQDPEIDEVSLIERSYEKGNHQVRMVYAFRSVSRAIPDIVSCLACFAHLNMILRQHP
jgi:hypothetical protein